MKGQTSANKKSHGLSKICDGATSTTVKNVAVKLLNC